MVFRPNTPCYISNVNYLCPEKLREGNSSVLASETVADELSQNDTDGDELSPRTIQDPDYKSVITDAILRRRMGRLLKMSVSCALKSLENIPSERIAGVITSTGMGFMKDTFTFGNSLFDREEELLNPSPFMQSTFNTASGYIALIRKIRAYNTTYVQRAQGFVSTLTDAALLLEENPGKCVIAGAFDEVTPEVDAIRKCIHSGNVAYPLGEGAAAFVLSEENSGIRLCAVAGREDKDEFSEVFNVELKNANVLKCSAFANEMGAFMSILPVLMSRLISQGMLSEGYTVIVDDVNEDGPALLLYKSEQQV